MKATFVDTNYWVAVINPKDQWHERTQESRGKVGAAHLVTTESVLIETLNYFSGLREEARLEAAGAIHDILEDEEIETVLHTHEAFLDGLSLYEARLDKSYSLTDCISMNVMRERSITDVLTHDKHFAQEGFNILL